MFEIGEVRANERYSLRQARRPNRDIFSILFKKRICYVFSLESPHRDHQIMSGSLMRLE